MKEVYTLGSGDHVRITYGAIVQTFSSRVLIPPTLVYYIQLKGTGHFDLHPSHGGKSRDGEILDYLNIYYEFIYAVLEG